MVTSNFRIAVAAIIAVLSLQTQAHAAECQLKLFTSVDLLSDSAAAFPAQMQGQPYTIALTSNSSFSVMKQQIADDLHLTLRAIAHPSGGLRVHFGSEEATQYTTLSSLMLGTMSFSNVEMLVLPRMDGPLAARLGTDFMNQFDVELDLAHKKMNLFMHNQCGGHVVYWTDSYATIPYKHGRFDNIVFDTTLDGEHFATTIGTLQPQTTLATHLAEQKLDVDVNTPNAVPFVQNSISGDKIVGYRTGFSQLELNGVTITNPKLELRPQPECKTEKEDTKANMALGGFARFDCGLTPMIIGTNILKKLRIFIATQDDVLYVSSADAEK